MGGLPNRLRKQSDQPQEMFLGTLNNMSLLAENISTLRDLYSALTASNDTHDEGRSKLIAKVRDSLEQNLEALEKATEETFGVTNPAKMRTGTASTVLGSSTEAKPKRKPGRPPKKKPVPVDDGSNTTQPEVPQTNLEQAPAQDQGSQDNNAQVAPMPSSPPPTPPTPPSLQS